MRSVNNPYVEKRIAVLPRMRMMHLYLLFERGKEGLHLPGANMLLFLDLKPAGQWSVISGPGNTFIKPGVLSVQDFEYGEIK